MKKNGELYTEGDTWHMIGRECQIQFGEFVTEKKETQDMQYKLFMFIANQRRTEANLDRTAPKDKLKTIPKGTRTPKKKK